MTTQKEWYECLKREARAKLIIWHGIDNPTNKQICLYILYGEKIFEEDKNE